MQLDANQKWILETAGKAAGRQVTPDEPLGVKLLRLSDRCRACEAKLSSRQIIALVVDQHEEARGAGKEAK